MAGEKVSFHPRTDILASSCVVGVGPVARALGARLLRYEATAFERLRGVATSDALLLLGPSDSLPWVDGVFYLGQDPGAPNLLLPTQLRPSVPVDAFERALLRHAREQKPPFAVLPRPPKLVSVAEARPLLRARLLAWLESMS